MLFRSRHHEYPPQAIESREVVEGQLYHERYWNVVCFWAARVAQARSRLLGYKADAPQAPNQLTLSQPLSSASSQRVDGSPRECAQSGQSHQASLLITQLHHVSFKYIMADNNKPPKRGGGLSLYANLLDPTPNTSATISRAPVAFQPPETTNASDQASQKHTINTGRYS